MGNAGEEDAVTRMTYDADGNLATLTDPEDGVTQFLEYDAAGNLLRKKDANHKTWKYTYDALGRLKTTTNPLDYVTQYFYDNAGNKIKEIDANNHATLYEYDTDGNLISITDAENGVTRMAYDAEGRLLSRTDAEGKTTVRNEYNLFGDLIRTTDGNDNVTEHVYNYGGNGGCTSCGSSGTAKLFETIYPTFTKQFGYDLRGRKVSETDVLSDTVTQTSFVEYDAAGNRTAVIDKADRRTQYEFDALNRQTAVVNALDGRTEYTYDSRDNLIALKDANNNTTTFEYDRNNRLVKETRPMGQQTRYGYNSLGNLIQKIDAKNQRTEHVYDDAGRLIENRYYTDAGDIEPVKTVVFTYDKTGNMLSYDDGTTSALYTYDKNNRKLTESVDYGNFDLGHSYTYYANGLKQSFTGPDNISYNYTYDENNQLSGMNIPEIGDITFENDAWNHVTRKILPGGANQSYEYSPLMRVKRILSRTANNETIMDYRYTYNSTGNITRKDTEHGAYVYEYDDLDQLISADNPDFEDENFAYDPGGNRITSRETTGIWKYNSNNELTGYDDKAFIYDENGSMTRKTENNITTSYVYNVQNRISEVKSQDGSTIAMYYYDPFGRRLWKNLGGLKLYFYYSDEGLTGALNQFGNFVQKNGYNPGLNWSTDPLFLSTNSIESSNWRRYFFQNDALGTPHMIIDTAGKVLWEAKYNSFGGIILSEKTTLENYLSLPGQYQDKETHLTYNFHRYFDSSKGAYLRMDPIDKRSQNYHAYLYAQNNPIVKTDPMGLYCIWNGSVSIKGFSFGLKAWVAGSIGGLNITAELSHKCCNGIVMKDKAIYKGAGMTVSGGVGLGLSLNNVNQNINVTCYGPDTPNKKDPQGLVSQDSIGGGFGPWNGSVNTTFLHIGDLKCKTISSSGESNSLSIGGGIGTSLGRVSWKSGGDQECCKTKQKP